MVTNEPLTGAQLNRRYVGESEQIIVALVSRCHLIPYATCCLAFDEIDALAPNRTKESSEGKIDKLSVLLTYIGGINDVSNLTIFGTTNRRDMIDKAFLRRMSVNIFMGRPSPQARVDIFRELSEFSRKQHLIELIKIATINFSGADCK